MLSSLPSADLAGLARLSANRLIVVTDSLAQVGLRGADGPDLRRHLSHGLFVDSRHFYARGDRNCERNALRSRDIHGMGVSHGETQVAPLKRGSIADPGYDKCFGKARRDACHHVGDKRPYEAVQRTDIR